MLFGIQFKVGKWAYKKQERMLQQVKSETMIQVRAFVCLIQEKSPPLYGWIGVRPVFAVEPR